MNVLKGFALRFRCRVLIVTGALVAKCATCARHNTPGNSEVPIVFVEGIGFTRGEDEVSKSL